jgi:hypothetical protein
MERRTAIVAVSGFAVLAVLTGLSFAFVDFAAAGSETTVDSQVSTASAGDETFAPSTDVSVLVVGDDGRSADLGAAVAASLRERGVAADRASGLQATYDGPVLFVVVDAWRLDYTPVAASARAEWRFLYVQSGNVTQFGASPPGAGEFSTERLRERLVADRLGSVVLDDDTRFVRRGAFTLRDETDGLLTLPAYDRLVRTAAADRTADAVLSG